MLRSFAAPAITNNIRNPCNSTTCSCRLCAKCLLKITSKLFILSSRLALLFRKKSGSHLLSHAVSSIVSSAAYVLTFVFGMRTGVSHKRIATRIFKLFFAAHIPLGSQQPNSNPTPTLFLRKEVIQPHLPIRLPCYDFTPVTSPAFGSSSLFRLGH